MVAGLRQPLFRVWMAESIWLNDILCFLRNPEGGEKDGTGTG